MYDVDPQAILWRPLNYFGENLISCRDALDEFDGFSYSIGNQLQFDLRRYKRHPVNTVSVYFSSQDKTLGEIKKNIKDSIKALHVPQSALAWQRGDDFEYGKLVRNKADRLGESEARILCLKIAYTQRDKSASTELIKNQVKYFYELSEEDKIKSSTRPKEQKWQQIIGNVICHRDASTGPFVQGYATRTPDGLKITQEGENYLHKIGFV